MSRPQLVVECAFTTDPTTTPTYVDISSRVLGVAIRRGRQYEADTIQDSTLDLRLDNADRKFDPTYTLSPFSPNVLPGRRIRVSAIWNGTTYRLFTGFVEQWQPSWDAPRWQSINVRASGGFMAVQNGKLVATANMLTSSNVDGGFESGTTGWTTTNGTLSQVTSGQQNGAGCGKLFAHASLTPSSAYPGGGPGGGLRLGMVADHGYRFTSWIFVPSGLGITLANIGVRWNDSGGGAFSHPTAFDTWLPFIMDVRVSTAPSDVYLEFQINETGAAKYILIDGVHLEEITPPFASDTSGAKSYGSIQDADGTATHPGVRIGECLNVVSWPTTDRALDLGQANISAASFSDTAGQLALSHIQDVAATEPGLFFINGAGTAVFQDRTRRYNVSSSLKLTDAAGITGTNSIRYQTLTPDFDISRVLNEVTATINGGTAQTVSDATSNTRYFRRSDTLTPLLTTDTDARQLASFRLALFKNPKLRFPSVTVKPMGDDNAWPHVLGREISDKVTVERSPDTNGAVTAQTISQRGFIEGVQHDITPNDWTTTWQVSNADVYEQFLVLGTGQLDSATNGVLAL